MPESSNNLFLPDFYSTKVRNDYALIKYCVSSKDPFLPIFAVQPKEVILISFFCTIESLYILVYFINEFEI
jgi:hypothetical protein